MEYLAELPELRQGLVVDSEEDVDLTLLRHIVKRRRKIVIRKRDRNKGRIVMHCAANGCRFIAQWTRCGGTKVDGQHRVNVFVPHSCNEADHKQGLPPRRIAKLMRPFKDVLPKAMCSSALQTLMQRTLSLSIGYKQAYDATQILAEQDATAVKMSYRQLHAWKTEFEQSNPGSVVLIHSLASGMFDSIFVIPNACIHGMCLSDPLTHGLFDLPAGEHPCPSCSYLSCACSVASHPKGPDG